jgi:hypothetical protein
MKNRITSFFPSLTISSPLFHLPLSSLFLTSLTVLTVLSANAQVPSYVPTNGLVGYWPFNGNANDESGNGNNGTVNGATLAADRFGIADKAYSFDGTSDFIEVSNSTGLNLIGEMSMSAWVKSNGYNNQNYQTILCKAESYWVWEYLMTLSYHVGVIHEGKMLTARALGMGNQEQAWSVTPFASSSWELWTVIYSQGNVKIFKNGILDLTQSFSMVPNVNLGSLLFGRTNTSDFSQQFFGTLDEIGIWNRALTADEVLALYNGCNVTPQVVTGNTTPSAFSNSIYTCNNNAGSTYTWTVNNGVIVSGQGTNSVTILWGAEGVGSVTVAETTSDGCIGDEVIYDVNVQCVVSGNEITGPVGPEAFSNSTYTCNGAANSTYNWTVTNGVIASGQGTNTVNILWASTGLGNISVVETTAEGCIGTTLSQDVVVIPTNVEELANQLILYPNPATTELNLQTTSDLIGTDLFVFDALGKQILKQQILSTNTIINTSSFAAGNYVVKVGGGVKKFEVKR